MTQITVTLHVDAAAAVRGGFHEAGAVALRLSAEDLRSLDDDEREVLAKHLDGDEEPDWPSNGPRWGDPLAMHARPISHADLTVLRALLRWRHEVMARAYLAYAEGLERAEKDRRAIGEAIEAVDPSWGPVYRDGMADDHVVADLVSRHVLAAVDQIAPRHYPDARPATTTSSLSREQHARMKRITRALPPGWAWAPWSGAQVWDGDDATWLECRGYFAGIDLVVRYDLDHDMPAKEVEMPDDDAIELQRKMSAAIRRVSPIDRDRSIESLRSYASMQDGGMSCDYDVLAAAIHDPIIWAALANVRTEIVTATELAEEAEGAA